MSLPVRTNIYNKQRDFILYFSQALERQKNAGELLALLEAGMALNGATSDFVSALDDYPPHQSAALISDAEGIEEVAPYLINLKTPDWYREGDPLTTFTQWLARQENFSRWGIFFVTETPFEEVRTFWQRFSHTVASEGEATYLRFYHPRFFHTVIKSLNSSDVSRLSKIVNTIFYFDYYLPNILHVYRYNGVGCRIKQYDLLKDEVSAITGSTMSDFAVTGKGEAH